MDAKELRDAWVNGQKPHAPGADLAGADLADADLAGANLRGANLRGADLSGATPREANLMGADLAGANLREADLEGSNLRGADLVGADLWNANLREADLRDADLREAILRGAYLRGTDLTGANLTGADLTGAYLRGADLTGADLTDADLTGTYLEGANLLGRPDPRARQEAEGGVSTKKRNSILTETENGTYYTGPLEPAKQAMLDEYGDSLTVEWYEDSGTWIVSEHRGHVPTAPNQWGKGETEEEAWRYFIGADFGPLDQTYDDEGYEAHQRKMLGLDPLDAYVVVATIKSPTSEPVEVVYFRGADRVAALAALVSAAAMDVTDTDMPESIRTTLVSVRMDVNA